jgi:4-hydroxythreonine-4-phosphate dehydrogenase
VIQRATSRSGAEKTKSQVSALALSMGDPAGIGLDITLKAWSARRAQDLPPFLLYADPVAVAARARALGLDIPFVEIDPAGDVTAAFQTTLPIHPVALTKTVVAGHPDAAHAAGIIASIELAVESAARGLASAVVTNPIAKSVLTSVGFAHAGHTEFLAELASRYFERRAWVPVMMLASDELRVVPLTVHIPLAMVPKAITADRLRKTAQIVHDALRRDFGFGQPRIAVAGLNPHAGEDGTIGREETEVIAPAIQALRAAGMDISGPVSADSMFHEAARARYDAAIAMYHDQALVPLKTLAFDTGVNTTLGLPFVRTSPDHGTAFSLAGTGEASPASLVAALKLADAMARRRAGARP